MLEDGKWYRVYYTELGNTLTFYTGQIDTIEEARERRNGLINMFDVTSAVVVEETIAKKVVE